MALLTVLIDALALELALAASFAIHLALAAFLPFGINPSHQLGLATGLTALPLAYYGLGLYPGYGMPVVQKLRERTYVTLAVFGALLAFTYLTEHGRTSRTVLMMTAAFAVVLPPLFQSAARGLLARCGIAGLPTLIIGAGRTGAEVARKLLVNPVLGLSPTAFLDDDPSKWGADIYGVPVIGPISAVSDVRQDCSIAVVAMPGIRREKLVSLVHRLSFSNLIIVPDLGIQTLWTSSRDLDGILGLEVRNNLLKPSSRLLKRAMDYVVAVPVFLAVLPVLAFFAAWIKIVSPGPAFYCQKREGEGGQPIRVWKLRTMHPDAERLLAEHLEANPEEKLLWMRHFKLRNDPRVIPAIGQFLRRSSLDELPQLWNVLRGEMSIVGPRPFPAYHLDSFSEGFRRLRTSVAPGMTGLWQVSARSDGDLSVQEAHDTYYIRNWSLWLDVYLLFRTIQTVLFARGAY